MINRKINFMKKFKFSLVVLVGIFLFMNVGVFLSNAATLDYYLQSAPVALPNAPDYEWWYGCSPTSAGMMMGYYDINGYGGLSYNNLVPGGTAELSTFGTGSYLATNIIASSGHISDFYSDGYGESGDDVSYPFHSFDSLADFMGTSQDSVGSVNGGTWFYYYTNGSPLSALNAFDQGVSDSDGMYGMWEYFNYAGYGDVGSRLDFYTQPTDNNGFTYGFTFDDYMTEIDAGRVVMIHVEGHSMFGYGYNAEGNIVYLHDTWLEGQDSMSWGGSYSGMEMWGVTCFTPTGGSPVPIPGAIWLLGPGLIGIVGIRRKYNK